MAAEVDDITVIAGKAGEAEEQESAEAGESGRLGQRAAGDGHIRRGVVEKTRAFTTDQQ